LSIETLIAYVHLTRNLCRFDRI